MRLAFLFVLCSAASAGAATHASWTAYMKENRYACPGPLDTLATPVPVDIGGKRYMHNGYQLVIDDAARDKDNVAKLGVLPAIKDTSAGIQTNRAAALDWFKKENVDWVIVNGDVALEEFDLEEVVDTLAASGLPLL